MSNFKSGIGQYSKFDYLNAVTSAKIIPEVSNSSSGKAIGLPSIFETVDEAEQRESEYINKETDSTKLGVETYLDAYSAVFLIYRPWEKCFRCKQALEEGILELPTDQGDYTCPHTQMNEYLTILNLGLKGDVILTTKEQITTPDGVQRIYLEWLAPNEERKRELERKRKKKREEAVYPPDIEAAFRKKEGIDT